MNLELIQNIENAQVYEDDHDDTHTRENYLGEVKEGVDSDASKFIRFVLGAMVMHSGIVMFF